MATTISSDVFSRSSASLDGSTMDNGLGGAANIWDVPIGSADGGGGIVDNTDAAVTYALDTTQALTTDNLVSIRPTSFPGSGVAGTVSRSNDAADTWVEMFVQFDGAMALVEQVAGVPNTLGSLGGGSYPPDGAKVYSLRVVGDQVTAEVDGTPVLGPFTTAVTSAGRNGLVLYIADVQADQWKSESLDAPPAGDRIGATSQHRPNLRKQVTCG